MRDLPLCATLRVDETNLGRMFEEESDLCLCLSGLQRIVKA